MLSSAGKSIVVKKFDFHCGEIDADDIQKLTGIETSLDHDFEGLQRYSVEAEEFADQVLAFSEVVILDHENDDKSFVIQRIVFSPDSVGIHNTNGATLPFYFFRQLINIAIQTECIKILVYLTEYDETIVQTLSILGFEEVGGYFSETRNAMVHEFSMNIPVNKSLEKDAFSTSLLPGEGSDLDESEMLSVFQSLKIEKVVYENDTQQSSFNSNMNSLISDLFKALHNEDSSTLSR